MKTSIRVFLGRLQSRILLGYFLLLLLPMLVVYILLMQNVNRRSIDLRQSNLEQSKDSLYYVIEQNMEQIAYTADTIVQNKSVSDIMSGNLFSVSDEVYTYNHNVHPLLNYLSLTNDVESIDIYRRSSSLLNYNDYIHSYSDLYLPQEQLQSLSRGTALWNNTSDDASPMSYQYCAPAFLKTQIYLGAVVIKVDFTDVLRTFALDNDISVVLRNTVTDDYYSFLGSVDKEVMQSEKTPHSTISLPLLHCEIILSDSLALPSQNIREAILEGMIVLAFATLCYYLLFWRYVRDISQLTKHIYRNRVDNALMCYPNKKQDSDEIGLLITAYNQLITQINDLINTKYIAEINRQKSENYAMRMQINPHFLYNTLECIRMTAYEHNDSAVSKSIYLLSNYMHYNLSHSNESSAFSDEIKQIRLYFGLMQLPMEDRFEGEIVIQDSIADFACPFFILQPIVENSFCHGFRNKLGNCTIKITVQSISQYVTVSIEDNGCGITSEEIAQIQEHIKRTDPLSTEHIGLGNVYARMKQFYGNDFSMELSNIPSGGVMTLLRIPMRKEDILEHTLS